MVRFQALSPVKDVSMRNSTSLYAVLAVSVTAIVAGLLYVNNGAAVHAGSEPPAVLDKLKLADGAPVAPDAAFVDATGKGVKLADFHGRYILVNLWATWCGPCITELPSLAKLNAELPQDRVTVVPIDMLEKVDAEKLTAFLGMHDAAGLPVYMDRDLSVQRGFVANELPLTILIDADGRIVAKAAGPQKWDDPASVAYLKAISAPPAKS
jgi:thiol-disulfide isomerase/thioredoxin